MNTNTFRINSRNKKVMLALGPESSGNFSVFRGGKIHFFQTGLDLLHEENFEKFKKLTLGFLRRDKTKPDIILTDLHPGYRTTIWGRELAKRLKIKNINIQHHVAHIFSAIGDKIIKNSPPKADQPVAEKFKIQNSFFGIACDGTGYGLDGKIWGGEVFQCKSEKRKAKSCERVGHLENQILIGGDLAVREPARMLISILSKFLGKKEIFGFVKKYYSKNEFEVLLNQLQSRFNCQETSSTARVLDAVAVLLGFSANRRVKKHGPALVLEKNSTRPYKLNPEIIYDNAERSYILLTTMLFEFLLKNFNRDKKRLAATVQCYIAQGLHEISKKIPCLAGRQANTKYQILNTYFSGGMADNKIMAGYFSSQGFYLSQKIPRGDAGLSFGQVVYYLLTNPGN
ncbi:MAG: hypothetical protein QMD77_00450 [Patescibacteria group bacterium]|nr:hypothetical protein [Patescibacteria group bacterium]